MPANLRLVGLKYLDEKTNTNFLITYEVDNFAAWPDPPARERIARDRRSQLSCSYEFHVNTGYMP